MQPAFAREQPMDEPLAAVQAPARMVHLILSQSQEEAELARLKSPDKEERRKAAATLANKGSMQAASKIESMILEGGLPREIKQDMGNALMTMSFNHASALAGDPIVKSRRMSAISMAKRARL